MLHYEHTFPKPIKKYWMVFVASEYIHKTLPGRLRLGYPHCKKYLKTLIVRWLKEFLWIPVQETLIQFFMLFTLLCDRIECLAQADTLVEMYPSLLFVRKTGVYQKGGGVLLCQPQSNKLHGGMLFISSGVMFIVSLQILLIAILFYLFDSLLF